MSIKNPDHIWKTTLFSASALGYVRTRIPALIRTAGGVLIAFCEGRDDKSDWAGINILQRRSLDGGETWDDVRVLVNGGGGPASNSTPIAGKDGTVHFLCQKGYNHVYYYRSGDDGLTWSEPREITSVFDQYKSEYDWKIVAPGPGHGIELKNGRLIVPLWLCLPAGPDVPGGDHRPSCATTIASDDGGLTWKRGDIIANTGGDFLHPSECVVAELPDGSVMINMRSESACHRRLVSVSPDGLTGWSKPAFDEALFDPVCMGSLLSAINPKTGAPVLIFCNPDTRHDPHEYNVVHCCRRENGAVRLSHDNGKTWPESRVIDAGPFGYSDMAFAPDGTVYCAYDTGSWGKPPHHNPEYVAFVRFPLEWITANPSTLSPQQTALR
ncbi:exo-alpha-sialidase [Opitutaceae bacterium TAV4]|nr:exo-alpha-sialidase [Opitutaceae bacterium TAV4]RRK02137.1 exo-alpha-sialidase [Opitutaceae bacterium TAV3]